MNTELRVLLVALMLILVLGIAGAYGLAQSRARAREACIASGRAYVIDHYETSYITQKIGTTTIIFPVQSPVYACVEQ